MESKSSRVADVKVICRFRPVNDRERQEDGKKSKINASLSFDDYAVNILYEESKEKQSYGFDRVFWNTKTTQAEIYQAAGQGTVKDVLDGYNGTIFAYGQTGTGKSFTMFGPSFSMELKGIIPRCCIDVFEAISNDKEGTEFQVSASFLEIYNEALRDLLNPKTGVVLKVRETKEGVFVENLTEKEVTCEQDILDLIQLGEKFRSVASTNMNEVSSRSHSLFILTVNQKMKDGMNKKGILNLVDLAGSESVGKTGATGTTLEEAKKINQSLSALGNCIYALGQKKRGHVPYRNSKLTHILRESLGGNCKTTLLITCSPHKFNVEETISTLKFGQRAKKLKNEITQNKQKTVEELEKIIDSTTSELTELRKYVAMMEAQMKQKDAIWSIAPPASGSSRPTSEEIPDAEVLQQTESELHELRELKELKDARIEQLTKEIQNLQTQKVQNVKEIEDLKSRLGKERENVTKLATRISKKEEQFKELNEKIQQAKLDVENHRSALLSFKEQNSKLEKELEALRQLKSNERIEEEKKETERMAAEKQRLEREIQELKEFKQQNEKLEDDLKRLRESQSKLDKDMQEQEKKRRERLEEDKLLLQHQKRSQDILRTKSFQKRDEDVVKEFKSRNEQLEKELLLMKQSNDELVRQKLEKERLLQVEIERQEIAKQEREKRREKAMQKKREKEQSKAKQFRDLANRDWHYKDEKELPSPPVYKDVPKVYPSQDPPTLRRSHSFDSLHSSYASEISRAKDASEARFRSTTTTDSREEETLEGKYKECIRLCNELLSSKATTATEKVLMEDLQLQQKKEQQRKEKEVVHQLENEPSRPQDGEIHMFLASCYMTMGNLYKAKRDFETAQSYYDRARQAYQDAFAGMEKENQENPQTPDKQSDTKDWSRRKKMTLEKAHQLMKDSPFSLDHHDISKLQEEDGSNRRASGDQGILGKWKQWWAKEQSPLGEKRRYSKSVEITRSESDIVHIPRTESEAAILGYPPKSVSEIIEAEKSERGSSYRHKSATFHREAVIAEMVRSERDYVNDLNIIVEVFIKPLRSKKLISERSLNAIFSNLETLELMNEEVCLRLEDRIKEPSKMHTVGDIFQQMGDYFKMYKVYCANQVHSTNKITELMQKSPQFKQFLKDCQIDPRCRKLGLTGFLIKPVQRICKYPLLFKELVRNTPEDHPDYHGLIEAKKKVEEIVLYVNEGQRRIEAQERMVAIQNSIDGFSELITPTRFLIREGPLNVQLSISERPIEHQIFLFNDILLLAKRKTMSIVTSKEFYFVAKLPMDSAAIAWSEGSADTPGKRFVVEVPQDKEPMLGGKGVLFSGKDDRETRSWFEAVSKTLEDFQAQNANRASMMLTRSFDDLKKPSTPSKLHVGEISN